MVEEVISKSISIEVCCPTTEDYEDERVTDGSFDVDAVVRWSFNQCREVTMRGKIDRNILAHDGRGMM